jgi:hypothetical protein
MNGSILEVGGPSEFEACPPRMFGALPREASSLNDAYLLKPATTHRKRKEESGLARRRGNLPLTPLARGWRAP